MFVANNLLAGCYDILFFCFLIYFTSYFCSLLTIVVIAASYAVVNCLCWRTVGCYIIDHGVVSGSEILVLVV